MSQVAIDFDVARAARDAGMAQSLAHAERVNDGWGDIALAWLTNYARVHREFAGYQFIAFLRDAGRTMPPDDRAFGAVFKRAAKAGVIERCGYVQHPGRHCSPSPLWRSLICLEAA